MSDWNGSGSVSRRGAISMTALGGLLAVAPIQAAKARDADPDAEITTPANAVVDIEGGRVRGFRRNGIYIYKGLPYGAATGGNARFLPPRKPASWAGVRETIVYGPVSPHPVRRDWGQPETQFVYDWDDGYEGEDCLRLNIWTAELGRAAKRPVMVWIHGGGFVSGSSQELPSYDGENLARDGVVLVSLNHRLGPLGFMDVSALGGEAYAGSANASILDLVLALEWVRDNIAQFGGDPDRVTIFGQSGGGAKVSVLMATPLAKGLFHRAIVQSGSFSNSITTADSQRLTAAVLEELGQKNGSLAALQQASPSQLIAAGDAAITKLNGGARPFFSLGKSMRLPRIGWGPVVDNHVFLEHPWRDHAPAVSRDVPLIVGTTREEFRDPTTHDIDWDTLTSRLEPAFGTKAPAVVSAFRSDFPSAGAGEIAGIIGGMTWRNDALRQAAMKQAGGGAPAYEYWFTWQPPVLDGRPGAFHCLDLAFCFNNTARCDQATGNTSNARALAKVMSGAWIAFAVKGSPSQPDFAWQPFEPEGVQTMVFDNRTRLERNPAGKSRAMLGA